jgi:hypothetical protein
MGKIVMCYFILLTCVVVEEAIQDKRIAKEALPTLDELALLSKGGAAYQWVCEDLLPFVVGYKRWCKCYFKEPISNFATGTDEAFLMVTLENNYRRWVDEEEWNRTNFDKLPEDQSEKDWAPAKYTNSGRSKSGGQGKNRHYQGWAGEGYRRFNYWMERVVQDRLDRAVFEAELLAKIRKEAQCESDDENVEEEEEEEIHCVHELFVTEPRTAPVACAPPPAPRAAPTSEAHYTPPVDRFANMPSCD